uniref:Cyclic nucleotide-binding domain-containing protein n=1 Tax=Glossina pallidipes TaxID=7398 RepID=A0A1A9ZT66_GLOPL
MENMGRLRKTTDAGYDTQHLLKSSPNILENFSYEDFQVNFDRTQPKRMTSPPTRYPNHKRSKSPLFCETLERHAFMQNVINTKRLNSYETRYSSPSEKEENVRRSLGSISKDIKEIEEFLAATENVMREEKEMELLMKKIRYKEGSPNKENKVPSPLSGSRRNSIKNTTYKINSFKNRRSKPGSPRLIHSRLYFRNGRIGCLEAENATSNVESTHALVKHILKYENEKPLVSPESVRKVLNGDIKNATAAVSEPNSPLQTKGASIDGSHTSLPGQVDIDVERGFELKPLKEEVDRIADKLILQAEETAAQKSPQTETHMPDEDEQDVRICYDELPEVLNEEENTAALMDSEIDVVDPNTPINVCVNRLSSAGSLDSDGQQFLREQVRHLVRRFTARANKVKSQLELPPTPSSSTSSPSPSPSAPPQSATRAWSEKGEKSPEKKSNVANAQKTPNKNRPFEADNSRSSMWLCSSLCGSNDDHNTLDPQGKIYIAWLFVVSISFLYNAWVIPLRSTFPFQTPENTNTWLIMDFCADIIYLLDVIFFKHRLMYLFEGFWVKDKNLTRKNYMRKLQFKLDLLSLLPLELLYFKYGTIAVYLRFPRFFKVQSFWEFFKLLDRVISSPHIVNNFSFNKTGIRRKDYISTGKNPKPDREGEYVFMTVAWLMGVFVFALLIGQIRDIISTATRTKNEYRQLEDETLEYMRRLNLSKETQKRVKMWFKFTWDQQRTLDESNILDSLPINLKTDIAISVHIQTLSKVQLFADCEEALLRDLVLKLRAVTFLPGDYVCRKGEVGREMYIIKLGQVQVMGGNDTVLATLSEGSVFGEISLLGINGADRRTADVRSKGFANLFVLSKADLNEVIAYYPSAQAILKKRARALMRKNAAREKQEQQARHRTLQADVVIGNPKTPENQPKLLQTVIQALPYESPAVLLITRGSKRMRKQRLSTKMETIEDCEVEEVNKKRALKKHDSFLLAKDSRANSPDLLSSIQNELQNKNQFINLTDSEKALIVSTTSSNDSIVVEDLEECGM